MTIRRATTRAAAGMGVATAVSRGFGFVRVLVVAAVLGTTVLGNTFQSSNSVSNVVFELVAAGALSAVLVPTFAELLRAGDQAEAERRAGVLLGIALAVLGALAIVGVLAAPVLARGLTAGSDPAVRPEQEALATFLLRFFVPQIVLYAVGTIATAVLYARRQLVVTALAPIGNTIVVVGAMLVFRELYGPGTPGLDLTTTEQLVLALGGTLGVAAFVAIPTVALWRSGFRLRPRRPSRDPEVGRLVRLSGWAVGQHAGIGVLLGTALVVGNAVPGGVVAYQVAFVFFLAPYAVLAQPLHTAILPDLAQEVARNELDGFGRSVRWALESRGVLVVPVTAALVALAYPIMRVAAFGEAKGVDLLAAGLASLAIGLLPYSAFLLLARACYALHDSRTPALVAVVTAVLGAGVMVGLGVALDGAARVAALGLGHSAAYLVGATVLYGLLRRRTGVGLFPSGTVRAVGLAVPLGLLAWWAVEALAPDGRIANAALVVGLVLAGGGAYVGGLRLLGGRVRTPAPEVP